MVKKKKKKHDKIVLLVTSKLNSVKVLVSKALINSIIFLDEFVLINNVLKENNEMKEEIKSLKTCTKRKQWNERRNKKFKVLN